MVINDLKQICGKCQGSGRLAGITNMGISQINIGGVCPSCKGKGFQLTELGEDVLTMLRPFIAEMIAEAVPESAAAPDAQKDNEEAEQ